EQLPTATLEIRTPGGMSPRLFVERKGGTFQDVNATLVDVFQCSSTLGDCDALLAPLKEPRFEAPVNQEDENPVEHEQLRSRCNNVVWEEHAWPFLLDSLRVSAATAVISVQAALAQAETQLYLNGSLLATVPAQWVPILDSGDYRQISVKGKIKQV